jgi:uncharacterized protein
MSGLRLCFSADIHGNVVQVDTLLSIAKENTCDYILLGGDLTPKTGQLRTVQGQRNFFENHLMPRLQRSPIPSLIMLGNDDFKSNLSYFKKLQTNHVRILDDEIIKLRKDTYFLAYSHIPPTPFRLKDWEKIDTDRLEDSQGRDAIFEGFYSEGHQLIPVTIDENSSTIERDFRKLLRGKDCSSMVWMVHAPPKGTSLDMILDGKHVGSQAIRDAILKYQPLLSLHGHIHESAEISGEFKDKLDNAWCYTAGNFPEKQNISCILVSTDNPSSGTRILR